MRRSPQGCLRARSVAQRIRRSSHIVVALVAARHAIAYHESRASARMGDMCVPVPSHVWMQSQARHTTEHTRRGHLRRQRADTVLLSPRCDEDLDCARWYTRMQQ